MPLWIIASLLAAAAQALRFMLQKTLSLQGVSAVGATYARFLFSAPLLALVLGLWFAQSGTTFPSLSTTFWTYALAGGLSQILATVCIVKLFQERHFAVGVTFAKTEVILTAALGFVLLADPLSPWSLLAIGLGVVGVVILSVKPGQSFDLGNMANRSAGLGLLAGLLFSVSAVGYRGASLEIAAEPVLRAAVTLSVVTLGQMLGLALWLFVNQRGQGRRVLASWRRGVPLGLASLAGSFGWFLAFTLQNAAIVKAVGQIELIFVLIIGALVFGERVRARELLGMALLAASILGIVAQL